MEAEARGVEEKLKKQAAGLQELVNAAGGKANDAVNLMITDKLELLVAQQVEAIKNIKIDKVTVWDSMNGENGTPTTANFLSGMIKSVPPLNEMFKQAEMKVPSYLGTEIEEKDLDKKEE